MTALRRFRILRSDGQGFSPTGAAWEPDLQWSVASNLLEVTVNTNGPIPVQKLCLYPRFAGCYISIRYAGLAASDKGSLHIVEPVNQRQLAGPTELAQRPLVPRPVRQPQRHDRPADPGPAGGQERPRRHRADPRPRPPQR